MSRFWQEHARAISLDRFRATDQYLWQPESYPWETLTRRLFEAVESDRLRRMGEDGAFGCRVWDFNGLPVSRDLLDSLLEIRFLEKHLPRFSVKGLLDIGAGYGRLAHRLEQTHPELRVLCTDTVPVSVECARAYLEHRKGHWHIVPPDRIPWGLVDVAANVHSWSECTPEEIGAWLAAMADNGVPWLFVIPHDRGFSTCEVRTPPGATRSPECAGTGHEFRSIIEGHGYRVAAAAEPEFDGRHYYLFHRS